MRQELFVSFIHESIFFPSTRNTCEGVDIVFITVGILIVLKCDCGIYDLAYNSSVDYYFRLRRYTAHLEPPYFTDMLSVPHVIISSLLGVMSVCLLELHLNES